MPKKVSEQLIIGIHRLNLAPSTILLSIRRVADVSNNGVAAKLSIASIIVVSTRKAWNSS